MSSAHRQARCGGNDNIALPAGRNGAISRHRLPGKLSLSESSDTATPVSAIALVVLAGLVFSCLDTMAKFLVLQGYAPSFVTWVRFLTHFLAVPFIFRVWDSPQALKTAHLPAHLLRGAFLFGSTIFNFQALKTLQLAETVSIFFFAPMVITALAGPLLGEWAGWRRWLAIGGGFVGVLIITRPGAGAFTIGHVFALLSMLSYSSYVIMTRAMGARETAVSLIFYSALAPTLFMAWALPVAGEMPREPLHWVMLLSLGAFGGGGHYLIIKAYQRATTGALAPYPYLQMIWMASLGYLVFGQLPDRYTVIGAGIILMSGLYIVHRERTLRLRDRVRTHD